MPDSGRTMRTLVWAVVALVTVTLGSVVALVVLAPPEVDRQGLVVQVLGVIAPTLAVLVTLRQVSQVQGQVDRVAQDTHDLTNGLLDRKVRSGVAEVLHPNLLDPSSAAQVAEDRQVMADRAEDLEEGP